MKKLLCPFDFSYSAYNAAKYAGYLAKMINAEVKLLHLMDVPAVKFADPVEGFVEETEEQYDDMYYRLNSNCKNFSEEYHVAFTPEVVFGTEKLSDVINLNSKEADLVIMGTQWKTSLIDIFTGSNTFKVLRSIDKPVLMIPERTPYSDIEKIAFGTKYHPEDTSILTWILQNFIKFDPEIHILHISPNFDKLADDTFTDYRNQMEVALQVEDQFHFHHLQSKDVPKALLDWINTNNAQVLAVATEFGSIAHKNVTKKLTKAADIPVLFIPKKIY